MKKLIDFCNLLKEEKNKLEIRRTPSPLGVSIFESISTVPAAEWNQVVSPGKALMRHPYLSAIEDSAPQNEESRYVLIYKDKKPVAAAVFHLVMFTGEDYRTLKGPCQPLEKLKAGLKDKARFRVLVCGHTHISGDHGFVYSSVLSHQEAYHALADACYQIKRSEKLRGGVDLQLIKDFYEQEFERSAYLNIFNYRQFKVDPNMILKIRPEWESFEDYLNAKSSKYRKKALSILRQGEELERVSLDAESISKNLNRIEELYSSVASKAKVRINHFDASYLLQLKLNLKEEFEFVGYFMEGKMVAFNTLLLWDDKAEAHVIGIDYSFNGEYAIYQNMLYDDVKFAIGKKKASLILGRTAMEMKSNIGAEPVEMCCYVRHSGPFLNRALKPVFNYIKPTEWIQRRPFKEILASVS